MELFQLMENWDYNIENFMVENYLGFAINRAALVMRKSLGSSFEKSGIDITVEEFILLNILWCREVIYQTELNEHIQKDKTIITRLLAKLRKKGIIDKKIDENDRRNYKIILTDRGRALKEEILPIVSSVFRQATFNIQDDEIDITINTLNRVFVNLCHETEDM